jgi:O-antigen/teichoic acid export membrane protein
MTASGEREDRVSFLAAWSARLRHLYAHGGIARTLARGAIWSLVISAGGSAIALGVQMLLTRSLGQAEYGRYLYALAWMNAALLLGKLELDTAALRFVGAYAGATGWSLLSGFLRRATRVVLLASLSVAILGASIVWLIRSTLPTGLAQALWIACALLPVTAMTLFKASCLQGFKRVPQSQGPNALLRPLLFGAGVVVAVYGFGEALTAPTAVMLNLLASIPVLFLTARFLRNAIPADARTARPQYETRHWLNTAGGLLAIAAAQLVLGTQADVLVIGTMLTPGEAGVYGAASQLASLIIFGVTAVVFIALPMISDFHARGRHAELQHLVKLVQLANLGVSLPVFAIMLFEGAMLLGWFGPEFVVGVPMLTVLSTGAFIGATTGVLAGFLLTLTGHQRQAAVIIIGCAVLNLVLSLTLTHLFGAVGTATATTTATLVRSVLLVLYCWKLLGVRAIPLGASSAGR